MVGFESIAKEIKMYATELRNEGRDAIKEKLSGIRSKLLAHEETISVIEETRNTLCGA